MIPKTAINVFLPAYNEAAIIVEVIQRLKQQGYHNIIVINDGSTDNTIFILNQLNIQHITHAVNRGVGAAMQTALEYARFCQFPYMILMDADGQHDVDDIASLVHKMETTKADLVLGSRFLVTDKSIPMLRYQYNQLANIFINLFTTTRYTDTQTGFRMLNSKAIKTLNLELDGYGGCSEMILQAENKGLKIEETVIKTIYTTYSLKKGQNFGMGLQTAYELLVKKFFVL